MLTNFDYWIKNAFKRAIKTFAQTFVAGIGTATMISEVNWKITFSMSLLAFILSIVTSIAGIPEVELQAENTELKNNMKAGKINEQP